MNWDWFEWLWDNTDELRDVTTVGLGIIGIGLLIWRSISAGRQATAAQAQVDLAQLESLYARYQKGADMLGDAAMSTRLGGIYSLRRLADEHPDEFHLQVMETLCAFLRTPPFPESMPDRKPREDMQSALEAVIYRSDRGIEIEKATETDPDQSKWFRINLREADLEGAWLPNAKLRGAQLNGVCLAGAHGIRADLSCATLTDGKLHRDAVFNGARFDHANMVGVDMSESQFTNATFIEATLSHNLTRANFATAIMTGARFALADFTDAQFDCADLSGVKILARNRILSLQDGRTIFEPVYCQVTQRQLDRAIANPKNPPEIDEGTPDIETGEPIVWNHQHCGDQWLEIQKISNSE